ncbi:S1 RNA-binding domain-containing protein [Belliella kenyensis]|uniref:S1 RNA-binding domain-containing protein n=1 Tax=Belliella kenyensis TaxID=1472724 RepID=A0ABV8EM03_9BACT|nr:S1-like domain-containing RNA-binding protein [Belliella kenyensis]MCH7403200.1 S1-like domain-containing RNA-binding protein [Belliella kenyensis]MDN3604811.1 S1-like domain-containing RNA-binding protein [Belliella kenyensis]
MKELGRINSLLINRFTAHGAYLALHDGGEVLLPKSYLPEDVETGTEIEVFVYTDSEDRPVAVTTPPVALLDEFAVMEAKEITKFGAFMDWGLMKDLFVPKSEMREDMVVGEKYLIRVCIDFKTNRLIGVNKYDDFLEEDTRGFEEGQEVEALVFAQSDLGYKALIEQAFEGLIYRNEVFESIELGQKVRAFVKKKREDGKIDLSLTPSGREKYEEGAEKILALLKVKKFLPLHDKSSPESIKELLGMSKKHFKQSIGQLYSAKLINIRQDGIELL